MYTDSKIWRCDGTFTFPYYTISKVISTGIANPPIGTNKNVALHQVDHPEDHCET